METLTKGQIDFLSIIYAVIITSETEAHLVVFKNETKQMRWKETKKLGWTKQSQGDHIHFAPIFRPF